MSNSFLLNDFYVIDSFSNDQQMIKATIKLNANHEIFKGHFEQMPVVPGVCQTQMIKEILQQNLGKGMRLTKGDNIKFMGTIVPTQNTQISLEISYKMDENKCVADAKLFHENTTFTKFKGEFIFI